MDPAIEFAGNSRGDRIGRALAKLPPSVIDELQRDTDGRFLWKEDPYYARMRVKATVTGAGPYTLTFGVGEITAFDYAQGQAAPASSGLPSSYVVKRCDTNLLTAGETNNGEFVFVEAVGFCLYPTTDWEIARKLMPELYCSLSLAGRTDMIRLGPPILLPGGHGLFGGGISQVRQGNLQESVFSGPQYMSNGLPDPQAMTYLSDALVWGPKGRAGVDAMLRFVCSVERAVTFTSAARVEDVTGEQIAGQAAVTATDADFTFLEALVVLKCAQIETRGSNR